MRWNMEMVRRGLVAFALVAIFGGWGVYAASNAAQEIGRTVAFGLKPKTIDIWQAQTVNRAAKRDRLPVGSAAAKMPPYNGPYLSPYCLGIGFSCRII